MATNNSQRTSAELNNPEYNYFIAFKIELNELNKSKIEANIKTVTGSPKGDLLTRRLIELKADAFEIMCNDAVYDDKAHKYVPNSGGRAKEAARAKKYKLEESVSLIGLLCQTRKTLLKSEIIDICRTANKTITYFTEEELLKEVAKFTEMGVVIVDNIDKNILFSEYQQAEKRLETLNKKDLYDHLGLPALASLSDIQAKAKELYKESQKSSDLKKKQAISQLDGLIKKILGSQQSRQAYDQYLALKKDVWDKFALIHSYNIREITVEAYEQYTQTVIDTLKVSASEAEKIVGIGCKYFQLNPVGDSSSGSLETCVFCGELTSKGAKTCKHCGAQLEKTCWNCKQSVRATIEDKPCPVCGATNYTQTLYIDRCTEMDKLLSDPKTKLHELEAALKDVKGVVPDYDKRINSTVARRVKDYESRLEPKRSLAKREAEKAQKKKKKRAVIAVGSSAAAVALALFLVVLFTFLIPLWSMVVTTSSSNDEYTVTGLKPRASDLAVLEIEESIPRLFFQKPKSVVGIGANAFADNTSLQKITLPKTINKIGAMAFANCSALTTVIINSVKPPQVAENTFAGTDAMLYVPEDSYEKYLVADGWRNYDENIFPYVEGVDDSRGVLVYLAEYGTFDNGKDYYLFPAYSYGSSLSAVKEPTRLGYVFNGWCYKKNGIVNVDSSTSFDRSTKLYAKWSPNPYTITFKCGDDVTMPSNVPTTYNIEQEVELPIPTRVGYVFDGWCTNADLTGTVYTKVIPVGTSGNLTLYPKWKEAEYNFRFVSVDGLVEEISLKTGDVIDIVPARPASGVLDGYMFIGWSTVEGSATADFATVVPPMADTSRTIFLYAVWVEAHDDWFRFERNNDSWWLAGTAEAWDKYQYDERAYLYLPSTYQGEPVVAISNSAFAGNTVIKAVDIPSSYIVIAELAFSGCTNLTNVLNGNSMIAVGLDAFADTGWLQNKWNKEYNKPWFLSLGHVALKYNFNRVNALNVTEDDFPEEVTVLGYNLFEGCGASSSNGTMVVPNRVNYIYDNAFANSGFANFTLPANVIYYGNNVFKGITEIGAMTLRGNTFDFEDAFKGSLDEGLSINKLAFMGEIGGALHINGGGKVTVNKLSASGAGVNGVSSGLKFTAINLEGFVKIAEIDLSYNSISSFKANGFAIGLLNLRNNQLHSLDATNLLATNLVLVANNLTEITCSQTNDAVKIIYMPSDTGYANNKLTNLNFASNMPNLLSLDVANNNVSNISGLFALTKLKELYLGGNPALNDSTQVNQLAQSAFCSNVVRLNLGGGTATSAILNVVAKCNNLEWLQIYGIGATTSSITKTISQSTHAKLKYLKISHNGFTSVPASLNYISTVVVDYYDNRQENEKQ